MPKSQKQKNDEYKDRQNAKGLYAHTLWVHDKVIERVKSYIARLNKQAEGEQ